MLRAAIIEPSAERRKLVRAGLESMGLDLGISDFSNEYDYTERLSEDASAYDILLLNTTIRQEGDGLRLAGTIRKANSRIMLCFLSDSPRYYAQAFSVMAIGYLLYPFDFRQLQNCICFYCRVAEPERRASIMVKEKGGNYRRIYTRYIRYIESANREIILHMEDGSELSSYMKLAEAEAALPAEQFFRCHQSYLVNFYFVEEIERDNVRLGTDTLPISRKYQKEAKDAFYQFSFRQM